MIACWDCDGDGESPFYDGKMLECYFSNRLCCFRI